MRLNQRRTIRTAGFGVVLVTLLGPSATTAAAQDRPSLSRLEEYACVAADERGDSYRPIFCDGRCDCLDNQDLSESVNCAQSGPGGSVQVTGVSLTDAVCLGVCSVSAGPCFSDGDCGGGEGDACFFGIPGLGEGACIVNGFICSDDSDCDQSMGFTCQSLVPGNVCMAGLCTTQGVCETGVQAPSFSRTLGFAPLGDQTPVTCDLGYSISSTDVAECIAQVEAHLGAGACVICGDGNLDAGEQCDDGNLDPGDGCAADCTTE